MSWQESFSILLWQELCAYYIIAMQWYQQGISISSNHGQAILVPVISRFSLFVSSAAWTCIHTSFPGFTTAVMS